MEITEEVFKKITQYVREVLERSCIPVKLDDDHITHVLPKAVIAALPSTCTLKDFLAATGEKKEKKKDAFEGDDKGFETFWNTYPATPTFRHKGRTFTDSRTLRSNKPVCRNKYLHYLHDNPQVTPELMLKALVIQLSMAKDESVEEGRNRLARWNGLEVYLNQAKFEPFLEMAASGEEFYSEDAPTSSFPNDGGFKRRDSDDNSNSA